MLRSKNLQVKYERTIYQRKILIQLFKSFWYGL